MTRSQVMAWVIEEVDAALPADPIAVTAEDIDDLLQGLVSTCEECLNVIARAPSPDGLSAEHHDRG